MHKFLTIVVMFGLFCSLSQAFGQEMTFGEKAKQSIEISIDESAVAHIIHKVEGSDKTIQVETYKGTMSNLSVTDKDGNMVQYLTLEKDPIAIVLPPSNNDVIFIKYDLTNVLFLKDNVWTWEYSGKEITKIYFPEGVDIIWINDRPIYIGEKGIQQHGGDMLLEYVINEPVFLKKVEWEDDKFTVGIRTTSEVDQFKFDQPTKSISFDVTRENSLISVIIPLKLLWEPYEVYLNGNKTLNSEFYNNGTHTWIGFKPEAFGRIEIIGTTVVPEFPLFVPLIIGISAVILIQFRNKLGFH